MNVPTVSEVRDGLKNTICNSIAGLIGYDTVPEVVQVPAVVVSPDDCDYQIGMGTCQSWTYSVYVLVPRTESRVNQDQLDAFISTSGVKSIPATLRADATLGLSGVDATLEKMSGYGGSWEAARVMHIGARLQIRIIITE